MASSTESVSFRTRRETKEAIEAAAKEAGSTVGDYLRTLLEEAFAARQNGQSAAAPTSDAAAAEVAELRRDVAAGIELLGVTMLRMFARFTPGGSTAAEEKEYRAWIAENLRRA